MKTKTLIVSDDKIKLLFKRETYKNGKEMSEVTVAFWKQYIVASIQARRERYEDYKTKQNEQK